MNLELLDFEDYKKSLNEKNKNTSYSLGCLHTKS